MNSLVEQIVAGAAVRGHAEGVKALRTRLLSYRDLSMSERLFLEELLDDYWTIEPPDYLKIFADQLNRHKPAKAAA